MYKYCPHCGKPFLEPDKPRTVGLVSQVKEFITWAQIKEWSDLREASKHFEIGDEIHDELKNGEVTGRVGSRRRADHLGRC